MTKEVCRAAARARVPVVTLENEAHGEIVYPRIREIGVIYASTEEEEAGYPPERLVVVLADRSGHSQTEVLARQLRLPTQDEAMEVIPEAMTLAEVDEMLEALARLREMEAEAEKKNDGKEG